MVAGKNGSSSSGFGSLIRRKQVDSVFVKRGQEEGPQLAKRLSVIDVVAIGVGATIGAGVYVLVGTVAREQAGPALALSFLIAGIAAALSAFCYAELASRCPSAGSAYHYAYICIGEGAAWLIGWALILEYTLGGSAIARGLTPNLALFFGGQENLPSLLARHSIPALGVVVDPCAAILVIIVTVLLCMGIKEVIFMYFAFSELDHILSVSTLSIMVLNIIRSDRSNSTPPFRYLPFGLNGMLAGSGIVFFSFIGFDVVASTAEEVKNPKRDLPIGMGIALAICCILYMLVSVVVVGLVPYYALDPDTPISSAFASYGMQWAVYIITAGAVTALCASLMGSLLPQVSVGTLLAFTAVAVSVLILRYVPPDVVPVPSSLYESIDASPLLFGFDVEEVASLKCKESDHGSKGLHHSEGTSLGPKQIGQDDGNHERRRKIAAWSITVVCIGVLILTYSASAEYPPRFLRFTSCIVGGGLLLCGLIILACIAQDNGRHSFGHTGGFTCPLVPFLPVACILINTYLLVNLGGGTWLRVSVWLLIGMLIYVFYGRNHSSLMDVVYVPTAHANKYHASSSSSQVED
ncbi:Cationic amino acid transporter 2, vacuolar [Linum perenne]